MNPAKQDLILTHRLSAAALFATFFIATILAVPQTAYAGTDASKKDTDTKSQKQSFAVSTGFKGSTDFKAKPIEVTQIKPTDFKAETGIAPAPEKKSTDKTTGKSKSKSTKKSTGKSAKK